MNPFSIRWGWMLKVYLSTRGGFVRFAAKLLLLCHVWRLLPPVTELEKSINGRYIYGSLPCRTSRAQGEEDNPPVPRPVLFLVWVKLPVLELGPVLIFDRYLITLGT